MKHKAFAIAALTALGLFALGLSGVATAGPTKLGNAISVSPSPSRIPVRLTSTLAPRLDASQPQVVIDRPILAGTIREDPPGTGLKRDNQKHKKKNWLQRKLFGS